MHHEKIISLGQSDPPPSTHHPIEMVAFIVMTTSGASSDCPFFFNGRSFIHSRHNFSESCLHRCQLNACLKTADEWALTNIGEVTGRIGVIRHDVIQCCLSFQAPPPPLHPQPPELVYILMGLITLWKSKWMVNCHQPQRFNGLLSIS